VAHVGVDEVAAGVGCSGRGKSVPDAHQMTMKEKNKREGVVHAVTRTEKPRQMRAINGSTLRQLFEVRFSRYKVR